MKLHTDSIGPARQDGTPIPPTVDWRPLHRGGRRVLGMRRLQPYRVTLICRLWRTLCPRATQWRLSAAPDGRPPASPDRALDRTSDKTLDITLDKSSNSPRDKALGDKALADTLRHTACHIARHVMRRIRRAPASVAPRRGGQRFVRQAGRGGAWWQQQSPCDGMPAAARDGTGR